MKQLHRRVVVTGLGILSPVGNTLDEAWDSCINGISGITNIDIDLENNPIKVGGRLKNFNPEDFLDSKEIRRIDPFIQYGIIAANQSIEHSGILNSKTDLSSFRSYSTCLSNYIRKSSEIFCWCFYLKI